MDFIEQNDDRALSRAASQEHCDDRKEKLQQHDDEDVYEGPTNKKHCGGVTAFAFP